MLTGDLDLRIHYAHYAAIIEGRAATPGEFSTDPRDRRLLGVKISRLLAGYELIPLDHS